MGNTEKRYWFVAKKYGYGWGFPCAWQGWAVLVGYILVVFAPLAIGADDSVTTLSLFLATPILIIICYRKGEPPKWRWGERS